MADDTEDTLPDTSEVTQDESQREAIPTQESVGDRIAEGGRYIVDKVLSIPQYLAMLMSKDGMYDSVYNTGPAATVDRIINTGVGESPVPAPQTPAQIGSPEEAHDAELENQSAQRAAGFTPGQIPMPQSRPAEAGAGAGQAPVPGPRPGLSTVRGSGSNVGLPQFNAQQGGPQQEDDYQKQVRIFGKDVVDGAWQLYPMVGQGAAERAAFMRSQFEQRQKDSAALERTQATAGGKIGVAEINSVARTNAAQIAAAATTERGRQILQGVIGKAQLMFQQGREAAFLKYIDAKIGMGQKPDEFEAQQLKLIATAVGQAEQANQNAQAPASNPLTPPAVGGVQKRPPPGWVKTSPVVGDQVNPQ